MLKRVLRGVYWMQSVRYFQIDDLEKAREYLNKLQKQGELKDFQKTFEANLLLCEHRYDAAKKAFIRIIGETGGMNGSRQETSDRRYLNAYCRALLHGIRGDIVQEKRALAEAASLCCYKGLYEFLPLYDPDNLSQRREGHDS